MASAGNGIFNLPDILCLGKSRRPILPATSSSCSSWTESLSSQGSDGVPLVGHLPELVVSGWCWTNSQTCMSQAQQTVLPLDHLHLPGDHVGVVVGGLVGCLNHLLQSDGAGLVAKHLGAIRACMQLPHCGVEIYIVLCNSDQLKPILKHRRNPNLTQP